MRRIIIAQTHTPHNVDFRITAAVSHKSHLDTDHDGLRFIWLERREIRQVTNPDKSITSHKSRWRVIETCISDVGLAFDIRREHELILAGKA